MAPSCAIPPSRWERSRPDAPAALVRIVDRCLRKEPDSPLPDDDRPEGGARGRPRRLERAEHTAGAEAPSRATGAAGPQTARRCHGGRHSRPRRPLPPAPSPGGFSSVTPPLAGIGLTQLTFDAGISGSPALSPDGSLLAFASDRGGAGNLDIWVQPVAGGERDPGDPRRRRRPHAGLLTRRRTAVYHSERGGGGIYSVPALGGEPRLMVEGGLAPRLSPDGRRLAYWTGSFIGLAQTPQSYRSFIVDVTGGPPRGITGFTNSRFPVWSPDGTRLILSASRAEVPTPASYRRLGRDGGRLTAGAGHRPGRRRGLRRPPGPATAC